MTGELKAKCPGCRGTTFDAGGVAEPKPQDKLRCTSCGRETLYRDLIGKLGKEAVDVALQGLRRTLKGSKGFKLR